MSPGSDRYLIAAAVSYGANLVLYEAELTPAQSSRLRHLLQGLADLGHLAAFAMQERGPVMDETALHASLRGRWDFVVDAVLAPEQARHDPPPAYLIPVWPFDHEREGKPASTARFLHLNLEVIATRTHDEEQGVLLPGRVGHWLVQARPILF